MDCWEEQVVDRVMQDLIDENHSISGSDSNDKKYSSIKEMWESEGIIITNVVNNKEKNRKAKSKWYGDALEYWNNCSPDVDGMLGGFAAITEIDLAASCKFLRKVQQVKPEFDFLAPTSTCCDCGAGIGRVSKGLLLPIGFQRCDLVEVSPDLIGMAPDYIGDLATKCRFLCVGLQDFEPREESYDLIWIQWVIGYTTDGDCVNLLKRCAEGIKKEKGVICIKDNTCPDSAFEVDKDDSSLTRSLPYLLSLCHQAGLRVIHQEIQVDFPQDNYPVPMIALERIEEEES